jgi:zinc protease
MLNALFPEGHPYNGAVIGSMQDLSLATLADVTEFFRQYYAPSNATLCIAGDLDPAQAKAWIERYFRTLPDRQRPATKVLPYAALPKAERLIIKEPVTLSQVSFGYRSPPAYTADDPALDVAMAILGGGKATRLYQRLVVQTKLAADVSASLESNQLASIASLSAAELARAKRRILVGALSSLELLNGPGGDSGRAGLLQRFEQYTGDPGYLPKWLTQIEQVQGPDVQRAIKQSLRPEARVVVITEAVASATREAP